MRQIIPRPLALMAKTDFRAPAKLLATAFLLCISALAPGRDASIETNTKAYPPNLDINWNVTVVGEFLSFGLEKGELLLTAQSGSFALRQVRMDPIGGKDRPGIRLSPRPVYWTAQFDTYGVVQELIFQQEIITESGQTVAVALPVKIRVIEQRVEDRPIVAEVRDIRIKGSAESQMVEYTFNVAFMGTYSKYDANFFARHDTLISQSGKTNKRSEIQTIRETLKPKTTIVIPDVRVSLMGPAQDDRIGVFRMALIGTDPQGNLITAQCDVPLMPPWISGGGAASTTAPASAPAAPSQER